MKNRVWVVYFQGEGLFPLEQVTMVVSCETETGEKVKGQGLCMSAALMGHFLIFWLESLYVHYLSYFLSKTPPSFAAACQWSQMSPERAFCAILE